MIMGRGWLQCIEFGHCEYIGYSHRSSMCASECSRTFYNILKVMRLVPVSFIAPTIINFSATPLAPPPTRIHHSNVSPSSVSHASHFGIHSLAGIDGPPPLISTYPISMSTPPPAYSLQDPMELGLECGTVTFSPLAAWRVQRLARLLVQTQRYQRARYTRVVAQWSRARFRFSRSSAEITEELSAEVAEKLTTPCDKICPVRRMSVTALITNESTSAVTAFVFDSSSLIHP